MSRRRILVPAIVGNFLPLIVAGCGNGGTHSAAAVTKTGAITQVMRLYDKPATITLTDPSGHVTSRPPYPQAKAGDVLDVYSLDYVGSHIHHGTQWSASNHLRCTFGHGAPTCESNLAIGDSLLVFNGNKLVGATGHYQGATGRVLSNKSIPGRNDSDVVFQLEH
jgi:hypothetical protein